MAIKPLDDFVVIEPIERTETDSGIALPESILVDQTEGTVIEAGPGRYDNNGVRMALAVKKGDKVLYRAYTTNPFDYEGKKYLFLRESDILAIID